jgi:ABC-type sugar transport system permease subunit
MSLAQTEIPNRADAQQSTISRKARRTAWFYAFIAPWLLGFVFLWIIPLVLGFVTSLTNYDGLNLASVKFVGLRNYARAFTSDADVLYSFGQTLKWTFLNLPSWMILSFILALILNQEVRGRGFFRTAYYLPSIVPTVALIWIWNIILNRNVGLLNAVISLFRPGTAIAWLTTYALQGVTVIAVWTGLGWGMIIFLAGLQGISTELLEAARIDGASTLQIFRHITIPLMTPVIFFVLVNGLIGSFQQFVVPQLLASIGGRTAAGFVNVPPRPIYLSMIHILRQIFSFQRFGYGIALLWLLFIVVAVLTIVVFRTARYWVYTEQEE